MSVRSLCAWAGLALSVASPLAQAGDDPTATRVAGAWMGHEASELLTTFPIDATANFQTTDDAQGGGMSYAFSFIRAGYVETNQVSDGLSPGPNGGVIVNSHSESVAVPPELLCAIRFHANAQGTLDDYRYEGTACGATIRSYRPKS